MCRIEAFGVFDFMLLGVFHLFPVLNAAFVVGLLSACVSLCGDNVMSIDLFVQYISSVLAVGEGNRSGVGGWF